MDDETSKSKDGKCEKSYKYSGSFGGWCTVHYTIIHLTCPYKKSN